MPVATVLLACSLATSATTPLATHSAAVPADHVGDEGPARVPTRGTSREDVIDEITETGVRIAQTHGYTPPSAMGE
jgi:hypothetical protein